MRFEAVRFALVGKNVCETAHANAAQQFKRGPEISASGPRGACEAPSVKGSFQFSVFSFQFSVFSFQFSVFSFQLRASV